MRPIYTVGIGAFAGGLEALERLFQTMPDDTGMAFVVVQHLSPDFKSLMNELLSRWTTIPVCTAVNDQLVEANHIYLMPPKTEMIISDGRLLLSSGERKDELRLPIDQFFRSLARDVNTQAIAIVLSGTGSDGSRGIRDIHECGGLVLAQSEQTAKFDGMPKSAIETGAVSFTLAPEEMPNALVRHVKNLSIVAVPDDESGGMSPIFRLLRESYSIDFSNYKPTTVLRRTERRLQLLGIHQLDLYTERLREDRDELDSLYRDLLIGVTSFFRDQEGFDSLLKNALPNIFEKLAPGEELRVWAAGCATGEEAYSLAILVHEQARELSRQIPVKIFATDGVEGLEVINRLRPSVALLDIGLPKIDGYQLARRLRADLGDAIFLVALTGYGRDEDHEAVLEARFNVHLVKPVNIDTLNAVLGKVLRHEARLGSS